jgi:hypothetical protein
LKSGNVPEMSVILVTERYETVRKTLNHLRAQTARDRLEIILVVPSIEEASLVESELREFCAYRAVEVGPIQSLPRARAPGIRHAAAPIVAFAESHSYPDPDWAEALIAAHRQSWGAVGPSVDNANSASMISWANFFLAYGRWFEPAQGAVIDDIPGRNSSYKRDLLLEYGTRLEDMLESEFVLHVDLQARGYQLYFEPRAKTYHVNISLVSSWLPECFNSGRSFASARARTWPAFRRFVYIGGAPLIPLVRLARTLREVKRSRRGRDLMPRIFVVLLISLVASAIGEMAGYAFGSGKAGQRLSDSELYKLRYVTEPDRRSLAC